TKADPSHAPTWQAWAIFEMKEGRNPARALEILNIGMCYTRDRKGRSTLFCAQGRALTRLGKCEEAEAAFKESLSLDERNAHTHYFYASELLEKLGRREEACQHYRRALELNPKHREAKKGLKRLGC
ncbi:MAG: tetratricopeptide repeat protein, partial [Anaerolineae bacterium]